MTKTGSTKTKNTTGTKKKSTTKSGSTTRKSSTAGKNNTTKKSNTTRRNNTTRKSSTSKKSTSVSNSKNKSREEQELWYEVGLIALFTFMIFLFLCNFGLMGSIGKFFKGIMFGLFGFPAYLFPAVLFAASFFGWVNMGHSAVLRKLSAFTVLYLLIGAVYELMAGRLKEMDGYDLLTLYASSAAEFDGGGVLGGSIAYLLYNLLDTIGSVLLLLVLCIICIVLMTERSFVKLIQNMGYAVKANIAEMQAYAEERTNDREDVYPEKKQHIQEQRKKEVYEQKTYAQKKSKPNVYKQEIPNKSDQIQTVSGINFATIFQKPIETKEPPKAPAKPIQVQAVNMVKNTKTEAAPVHISNNNVISKKQVNPKQTFVTASSAIKPSVQTSIQITREVAARFLEETDELHELRPKNRYHDFPFVDLKESVKTTEQQPLKVEAVTETVSLKQENISEQEKVSEQDLQPKMPKQHELPLEPEAVAEPEVILGQKEISEELVLEQKPASKQALEPEMVLKPEVSLEQEPGLEPEISSESNTEQTQEAGSEDGLPEETACPEIPKTEQTEEIIQEQTYQLPPVSLLHKIKQSVGDGREYLEETANRLKECLHTFGVNVTITDISQGPAVTRYELQPEQGVKVSKIVNLSDDIKLNLAATDIRIEAPIPGKSAIGIEVPNKEMGAVGFRELVESEEFKSFPSKIGFAVGKDIAGKVVLADIAKMPHMLIAGSTGSGKSVCINTIIMSILYKARPDEVQMIMIDPKVVELSVYNDIPHLLIPVVTDPKQAASALQWGVNEMMSRYNKFTQFGNVRDIKGYNAKIEELTAKGENGDLHKLPRLVIIVDELADLMMVAAGEVEESICRLAQLARAAGIHLIIATQRPSVDVITGLIKANMPSRVAFAVSSGVDSRTILDMNGAEKLLGKGDMLFYPQGYTKPVRVQGAFVSDSEVGAVVDFLKNQKIGNVYQEEIQKQISSIKSGAGTASGGQSSRNDDKDALFADAGRFVIEKDKASIGMLQRVFKIGFNRAARIVDQLCDYGVVGEEEGTKPRKVLMSMEQFENLLEEI